MLSKEFTGSIKDLGLTNTIKELVAIIRSCKPSEAEMQEFIEARREETVA